MKLVVRYAGSPPFYGLYTYNFAPNPDDEFCPSTILSAAGYAYKKAREALEKAKSGALRPEPAFAGPIVIYPDPDDPGAISSPNEPIDLAGILN